MKEKGKTMRRMDIVLLILVMVFITFILISYASHKLQFSKDGGMFVATGQLVEIDGRIIHVYSEGDGKETLVFMSGVGTSSPVLKYNEELDL